MKHYLVIESDLEPLSLIYELQSRSYKAKLIQDNMFLDLRYSPIANWYYDHPNNGWTLCSPCEATSVYTDLNWRIKLGE